VKFAKNGSDATTAAVKLARAWTGRDLVAICEDQPFFSTDDWFIGTTAMPAGIPQAIRNLTVGFRYNDLASVERLLDRYAGRIACLVLEPATAVEPAPGFLEGLRRLCDRHGTLLVFDEMITGFRWHTGGAQQVYGVTPDLSTFGKGMGNGFAIAALAGRREIMELGGLRHRGQRVFLLSTTHGAEAAGLAAAMETMRIYASEPVIETLYRQGERLRRGVEAAAAARGVADRLQVFGRAPNLIFVTRDAQGERSQSFRALFMQELIRRGVLGPSFVISQAHGDADVDRTIEAVDGALGVYRRALEDGVERHLHGPPVQPVFRPSNR
jgi:glutamate-1-semialdehyde 2,1-aminomutase